MEKKYCKLCGKELSEQQIKRGKLYCGRSCAMKAAYQNPNVRQKVSENTKKALNKPEIKEKHITGIKRAYKNPEYRYHISEAMKLALNKPEVKIKLQEAQKRIWQNEEYRQKISNIRRQQWSKEGYKENMAIKISNKWKEDGYKERVSQKISESLNKPEIKEKRSNSIKVALANPKTKERQRLASKLVSNSPEVKQKIYNTKKANNSFNSSKSEQIVLELLRQKFNRVQFQYRSNIYPFNCDFYIEDLELFIELHFNWTHGYGAYDKNNRQCQEQLFQWQEKAKTSDYYKRAIYTWTDLDVRKLQTLKDNKLNYKIFYNWSEFEEWYKEL